VIIKIDIANKRARVEGDPVIICGNSDYFVEFSFDADWSDLAEKKARFLWETPASVQHVDVVITGNTAAVPVLSGVTEVQVGVFSVLGSDLRATTPARIPCDYSVRCIL
jgi:hypothetical protein